MTRRICEVSLQNVKCKAPAAYGSFGAMAEGDGSCRGTCVRCGAPCCAACSRRRKDGRTCNDCIGSYAKEAAS